MNRTRVTPLPRSLDPLPGESLTGFLLRLSYRLAVPPADLMRRTGLSQGSTYVSPVLSTALTAAMIEDFSVATRLSPAEVEALTLRPLARHFPPVRQALQKAMKLHWLFGKVTRYCPRCLAGDDSLIQRRYGGTWPALWRLPDVFLCIEHRCFLEHLCPACGQPITGNKNRRLISRSAAVGLHPAQCRASVASTSGQWSRGQFIAICGARLDQFTPPDAPSQQHIDLQARILAKLDPHHPAEQSARYFSELHLLSSLVIATWPAGNLQALDPTAITTDRVLAERRSGEEASLAAFTSNAPPVEARACAAILLSADSIHSAPDRSTAMSPLMPTYESGGRRAQRYNTWEFAFKAARQECSPEFQRAAVTILTKYQHTGQKGRRRPHPQADFCAQHVPAFLLDEWADRYFTGFPGVAPDSLRRSVAVLLVQRVKGGSAPEAAKFLGINQSGKHTGLVTGLTRHLRSLGLLDKFHSAIDSLAEELPRTSLINYRRRREAMLDWTLPTDTWHDLLERTPMPRAQRDIAHDDRKRLSCSIYIWAQVTKGEQRFAPCPPGARSDPGRHYLTRGSSTGYTALKRTLDTHAKHLSAAIDAGHSTGQIAHSLDN